MDDIVYFEINDWFRGRDYPPGEPFDSWMKFPSDLSSDDWCKEQEICVVSGNVDMSRNWVITAKKSWVEKNCPQLLTDDEYEYVIRTLSREKEYDTTYKKKYSDFVLHPNDFGSVYGRFDWPALNYEPNNFGSCWYDYDNYDLDDEEDDYESL
jgi:hypothetical protein